jgi:hypothetical protein
VIRDRLDDLGWYQFEWLVQSLLKAELGLGIESWGGRGDFGRDAYFSGYLEFPAKGIKSPGPFVFQVKFIENANAAGAKPAPALQDAVSKEIERIHIRRKGDAPEPIAHYSLWTNAVVSNSCLKWIAAAIKKAVPGAQVSVGCGNDISHLLDRHPELRRSFPQILSLRDLTELIQQAAGKELLERSRSAIELSRDLVRVFVPTSAYIKAWQTPREHHFAVLEGPPETGKTAIARMIAFTQLSLGWDAITCDAPADFFQGFRPDLRQVFVADDAFGRTEYDPSRGSKWETNIDRVYHRLDPTHWLIWTSRKHILERARRSVDFQGELSRFPNPGAVLVQASGLSLEEKSLMLYRHARSANIAREAKDMVRQFAVPIVKSNQFTPERIRAAVNDQLPEIAKGLDAGDSTSRRSALDSILEAIGNPTDRMRTSFRGLPPPHKWLLVALLEAGYWASENEVRVLYEKHCPVNERRPFGEVFEELTEAFIKKVRLDNGQFVWVDWTHPSCRDMVIDELAKDPGLLHPFLESMSLHGIKLAVSTAGGRKGKRCFPFITSQECWKQLEKSCVAEAKEGSHLPELLRTLRAAVAEAPDEPSKAEIVGILTPLVECVRTRWNERRAVLDDEDIREYCEASLLLQSLPPLPNLRKSWEAIHQELEDAIAAAAEGESLDEATIRNWSKFLEVVKENEPRLLRQLVAPSAYSQTMDRLFEASKKELDVEPITDSSQSLREAAEKYKVFSEALREVADGLDPSTSRWEGLTDRFAQSSAELNDKAYELEARAEEEGELAEEHQHEEFDIQALFSDL